MISEAEKLPQVDMLIANLLIEYIGYECFKKVVKVTRPQYASCIIQINVDDSFVSDSPYLHAFDGLEHVHHQMAEQELYERNRLSVNSDVRISVAEWKEISAIGFL